MGKINSIKISREELDKGFIPTNHVMVECDMTIYGKKTGSGIVYGFDEDIQFAMDGDSHEADVADVHARVYKVPLKLYYNKEDQTGSMGWLTDMEVKVGDLVWYPPVESRNATALECEGKYYKLLPYADIIVAKRDGEVICLNGKVLLEYIYKTNTSDLAISKKGDIDPTKGIIRYCGVPNKEYFWDEYIDFVNLEIGDLVLLQPNTPQVPLERKSYNLHFDNGKMYFVTQRRRIAMVLSKGN